MKRIFTMALLLAICGCSSQKSSTDGVDTSTGCSADYQCPPGYRCDIASHECVLNTSIEVDLVLEITPFEESEGYLSHQLKQLSGQLDTLDTEILLDPTSTVRGVVARHDGSDVETRLEFKPIVEGFPATMRDSETASSTTVDLPGPDNYSIKLLPGLYEVTVSPRNPDSDSLPPLHMGNLDVDFQEDFPFDVTFPESFRSVSGTLLLANEDPVPHSLKIWAVDQDTGLRVSTVATTGIESPAPECSEMIGSDGQFCLVISPTATTIELRVAPGEESAQAAAYPWYSLGPWDLATLDGDEDGVIDLDLDTTDPLQLPVLGDLVTYKAKVEGITSAGTVQPVEGVAVNFTSERDGASFDVYSITNDNGEICHFNSDDELVWGVMLRENVYEVTIIPPINEEFESLVLPELTITYTGDGILMGQLYQLTPKPPFVAQVTTFLTDEPIEGLTAELLPIRSVDTGEETYPLPRYTYGQTGLDGMLRLQLDRGAYDLLVRATTADGIPWLWAENVQPDNEDSVLAMQSVVPIPFTGWLSNPDHTPAAEALIDVWEVVYSPEPDEPPTTRLVWEATTSSTGQFEVLLSQ